MDQDAEEVAPSIAASPGFLLSKAAELAEGRFLEALEPYGLSPRQYGVLALIAEQGPSSQQQIGRRLRIDRTTMVTLIDTLESAGFVVRVRDAGDRRRYALTLTEAGSSLVPELHDVHRRAYESFLSVLDPAEAQALLGVLQRLIDGPGPSSVVGSAAAAPADFARDLRERVDPFQ